MRYQITPIQFYFNGQRKNTKMKKNQEICAHKQACFDPVTFLSIQLIGQVLRRNEIVEYFICHFFEYKKKVQLKFCKCTYALCAILSFATNVSFFISRDEKKRLFKAHAQWTWCATRNKECSLKMAYFSEDSSKIFAPTKDFYFFLSYIIKIRSDAEQRHGQLWMKC